MGGIRNQMHDRVQQRGWNWIIRIPYIENKATVFNNALQASLVLSLIYLWVVDDKPKNAIGALLAFNKQYI